MINDSIHNMYAIIFKSKLISLYSKTFNTVKIKGLGSSVILFNCTLYRLSEYYIPTVNYDFYERNTVEYSVHKSCSGGQNAHDSRLIT